MKFLLIVLMVLCQNPWGTGPATIPQGPFICPVGQSLNQACVDDAEADFEVCAEAARSAAFDAYEQACDLYDTLEDIVEQQYQNGSISYAEYKKNLEYLEFGFNNKAESIAADYWSAIGLCSEAFYDAMEDCCEGD